MRTIHFVWHEPRIGGGFQSGVSLHSHTQHSRESLAMVPSYARSNPLLDMAMSRVCRKYSRLTGRPLDFSMAYFVPPLSAGEAYWVEAGQIDKMLGLAPMVSITDHDTIGAPKQLRVFMDANKFPISMEWTALFGRTHFHVGVHNIPEEHADTMLRHLDAARCRRCRTLDAACAAACEPAAESPELLQYLASFPDVLLVLNHPLWDVSRIGEAAHRMHLTAFLRRCRPYIHALELNGLRSWDENTRVMQAAEQWGLPVISGGDRHGREPNAILNLTRAQTFADFVHEIRDDRESVVVFMRQYQQPLRLRKLKTVWDVLRESENASLQPSRWTDRICVPWTDGRVLPLSASEWSAAFVRTPDGAEGS